MFRVFHSYLTLGEYFTMHKFCDHIKNKSVISFSYKNTTRVVEPHLLGHDKDGDLTLSAWQLSGGSGQGFRDFHVSKISGVATTGKNFERARLGYNPNDRTLSRVLCRI
jgi:predicted DNA-binding transcriptional regulator YafY